MNQNFLYALEIMWKGMLGIFTVLIVIMFVVMILTKLTSKKNKN